MATEFSAVFLQSGEDSIIIAGREVNRLVAGGWYQSAIKADTGIGEEPFKKDMFPISNIANTLINAFGDV